MPKLKSAGIVWPYLLMGYFSLLCLGFLDNSRAAIFENMTKSLGLSDEMAALFFVVPSLMAFLSSMMIERFMGRLGAVLVLRVGLAMMGAAFFMFSFTGNYNLILLETTVFGFGFGLVSVAQNVAVARASDNSNLQRQLFSGLHSMYALASLFSPLMAGILFSSGMEWSQILLASAIVPSLVLLVTAFLPFDGVRLKASTSEDVENDIESELSMSHAYFFSVSMSVYLIAEISVSSRLVVHVRRLLEIGDAEATQYLTAFFICLLSGRLLFSFADFSKFKTHHLMQFCLFFSWLIYSAGLIWSPWLLSVSGFFMAPFFPLVMDYAVRVFHQSSSRVIAYCMAFASLAVVFMHYGLGAASDKYGLHVALWIGPVALFTCLVLLLLERKLFHSDIPSD